MRASASLSLALALMGAASTAPATTYDASADFSGVSNPNPNGIWSEGYTTTLGSALVLFNQFIPHSSGGVDSWTLSTFGTFEKNNGSGTTASILPGQAALHPGSGNQYGVLRFTAPAAGNYTVAAQFFQGDVGDTDANILLNSNAASPVFFAATTDTNPSFNSVLNLHAGDTVDFVVGSKGSYLNDTTPIQVTITSSGASDRSVAQIVDAGGRRAASVNYVNDGSLGEVTGISSAASPVETAKQGFVGQLYEIAGVAVNSTPSVVNETATLQLSAWQVLDDSSFLGIAPTAVTWSVLTGPIASISTAGVATAGTVYQNTAATVQGSFGGFSASGALTVLDTIPDNFGSYANDGIADSWQIQYFGENNPLAGPNVDADGTGQTNFFKYVAGLDPLDPSSRFTLNILPVSGQPTQKAIVFSPRLAGRTYTVTYKTSLSAATWTPVAGATFSDTGSQRTVIDPSATGATKFYRVEITAP